VQLQVKFQAGPALFQFQGREDEDGDQAVVRGAAFAVEAVLVHGQGAEHGLHFGRCVGRQFRQTGAAVGHQVQHRGADSLDTPAEAAGQTPDPDQQQDGHQPGAGDQADGDGILAAAGQHVGRDQGRTDGGADCGGDHAALDGAVVGLAHGVQSVLRLQEAIIGPCRGGSRGDSWLGLEGGGEVQRAEQSLATP